MPSNRENLINEIQKILSVENRTDIEKDYSGNLLINYTSEYESPSEPTLEQRQVLIKLFGATDVRLGYEVNSPGCETCDYGSEYGWKLLVVKPTKHLELFT